MLKQVQWQFCQNLKVHSHSSLWMNTPYMQPVIATVFAHLLLESSNVVGLWPLNLRRSILSVLHLCAKLNPVNS